MIIRVRWLTIGGSGSALEYSVFFNTHLKSVGKSQEHNEVIQGVHWVSSKLERADYVVGVINKLYIHTLSLSLSFSRADKSETFLLKGVLDSAE